MIKLIEILNEIKIISKIDPKIIEKLFIDNLLKNMTLTWKIGRKYRVGISNTLDDILLLSKQQQQSFYKELLDLNAILHEIKILGKITPEMVEDLWVNLVIFNNKLTFHSIERREFSNKRFEILKKYKIDNSSVPPYLNLENINNLNGVYKELLDLKQEYNIQ